MLYIQVYLNALALLLRVHVRGHINFFEERLKVLVSLLTDQVSHILPLLSKNLVPDQTA